MLDRSGVLYALKANFCRQAVVRQNIQKLYQSGKGPPGRRLATVNTGSKIQAEREAARYGNNQRCGTSSPGVCRHRLRVLNKDEQICVSPQVRARIFQAAHALGYVSPRQRRAAEHKRRLVIGVADWRIIRPDRHNVRLSIFILSCTDDVGSIRCHFRASFLQPAAGGRQYHCLWRVQQNRLIFCVH